MATILIGGQRSRTNRGKLQPVHRAWHLDIGEDELDSRTGYEDRNSFVRICRLNDFKAGMFDHLGGIHP